MGNFLQGIANNAAMMTQGSLFGGGEEEDELRSLLDMFRRKKKKTLNPETDATLYGDAGLFNMFGG